MLALPTKRGSQSMVTVPSHKKLNGIIDVVNKPRDKVFAGPIALQGQIVGEVLT